jgi:hypothetical protein
MGIEVDPFIGKKIVEEYNRTVAAIEDYLKNELPKNPERSLMLHAEDIAVRVWQVQDEIKAEYGG